MEQSVEHDEFYAPGRGSAFAHKANGQRIARVGRLRGNEEAVTMITRIWRGWTTPQNADAYERLLLNEVTPGIAAREIAGYRGITVGRRDLGEEVEFVTIMRFDSLDSVKAFAGEIYERSVVPPHAREVLKRFDEAAQHYDILL